MKVVHYVYRGIVDRANQKNDEVIKVNEIEACDSQCVSFEEVAIDPS